MANATPLQIAAIYQNALGRTNVDAEGLAYWSQHPIEDLLNTAQGITGNKIDPNTYKPVGTSAAVAPGAATAIANAAAIDPGYSTASYAEDRQAIDPAQATVATDNGLWTGNTVDNVAAGQGATQTLFTPTTTVPKTTPQVNTQMKPALDYMHSLNSVIRAAQDKEHGPGTPDTFQITPAPGKTAVTELQKWNSLDPSIDPAYAQMFNDMNGWYMRGNENLAMNADGTQMVPGSQWINNAGAADRLIKSFDAQIAQDKKPGLLQKALPALAIAGAIFATGPAGAGWWGATSAEAASQATAMGMLEAGNGIADVAAYTGLAPAEVTALSNAAAASGGSAGLASAITNAAKATGASVGDILKGVGTGMSVAQIAALGAGAIGVLNALGQPDSKTTSTDPWGPQQPYLKDLFNKAQNLSNQPALSIDQKLAQSQADKVRMSVMSQDASKGYGMQKPVDMATARLQSLFSPNTTTTGQVTQDAYANRTNPQVPEGTLFSRAQPDPVADSIWDMYANDPTARQYNPNGPDQAAIDYWKGQIAQNGLSTVQNTIFPQLVASTASGQAPTTEGMASTPAQTGGGFGQQPSQYSQTLANANINPYLDASVTPGKIDPLANNAYLGKTTAPTTNAFIGQTVAPTDNSYIGQKTNVGTNAYLGQDNPYLQKMVDYASQDISNAWLPETMRMQRQSGAYGNSGLDQQRQKELLAAQGRSADTLRFQDYGNQQQLSESDVARRTAADAADLSRNTSAMQGQQQFNAGLTQADLARNLTATQNQGQFNAGLYQTDLARNAGLQQDINKTNAGIQGQNVSNLIGTQQNDLARNSEIWNAGANRDLSAYQFNLGQQLGTANGTPAYNQAQQDNLWSPILNYNKALTGGVNGGQMTTPMTTNPWTAGLSAAYTGYKLFGG